jgi:hypothetical protein
MTNSENERLNFHGIELPANFVMPTEQEVDDAVARVIRERLSDSDSPLLSGAEYRRLQEILGIPVEDIPRKGLGRVGSA